MNLPTFDDVESAARQIVGAAHVTPVATSRSVNARTGAEVFFKCENMQRAGARDEEAMSYGRRAARRDDNEAAIVEALRAVGASVEILGNGDGVPDLLVGYAGRKRRIGFIGFFVCSLLVPPVIGPLIWGLILLVTGPKKVHIVHVPPPTPK